MKNAGFMLIRYVRNPYSLSKISYYEYKNIYMFKCYFSRKINILQNILSYFILLSFYSRITFKKFSINGRASMTKYGQKLSYLNAIEGWLKPTPELLSSQSMEIMMGLMDLGRYIIENTIKKDVIIFQ